MSFSQKRRKRHPVPLILILLVILAAVLISDSNSRIVVNEYELLSERLPAGFDGFSIVQLSDLHLEEFGENNSVLLKKVREISPDMIAVTGDLIDKDGEWDYVSNLITELKRIAPVYYVSGNHEWAECSVKKLFPLIEGCGAKVLRNEYVTLTSDGDEIILAGVDDPNGPYDQKTPEELVSEIREREGDRYIVMLAHRNTEIDTWAKLKTDTVLCGHAHGGLIRLPFTDGLIAPGMNWFPGYTSGVYREGDTAMVVSRGLGNTGSTFRILNNPHIPVIILKTK